MPYHVPKNLNKLPSKQMQNIINKSGLHHVQKRVLMKHSNHHTKKHINMMINFIKKGSTFRDSHIKTINKLSK